MPGYVWCKCSVCSQRPAGGMRQIAITAQRHTEILEACHNWKSLIIFLLFSWTRLEMGTRSDSYFLNIQGVVGSGALSYTTPRRWNMSFRLTFGHWYFMERVQCQGVQTRCAGLVKFGCVVQIHTDSPPLTTMMQLTHVLSTIHNSRLPFRLNQGIYHKEMEDFSTIKHRDHIGGSIWCRKMGWATEAYTGAWIASKSATAL